MISIWVILMLTGIVTLPIIALLVIGDEGHHPFKG